MIELTVNLRLITPLYLGGADPNIPELRLSSIKGALRYWYRAIFPKYSERISEEDTVTYEEELFGGKYQSRVWIRDQSGYLDKTNALKKSYLTFFLENRDSDEKSDVVKNRSAFSENQTIRLQFFLRPSKLLHEPNEDWRAFIASLWMLGHVGGLGSRSRRGFGSVALCSWEVKGSTEIAAIVKQLPIAHHCQSIMEWMNKFRQGLQTIRKWFPAQSQANKTILLDTFDGCYYQQNPEKAKYDWFKAIKAGGNFIKDFRSQNEALGLVLGLPTLKKEVEYHPKDEAYKRVASPIWLRIIKIQGKYYPFFAVFQPQFPDVIEKNLSQPEANADDLSIQEEDKPVPFDEKEAYVEWCNFLKENGFHWSGGIGNE